MIFVTTEQSRFGLYSVTIERLKEDQYKKLIKYVFLDSRFDTPASSSSSPHSPPPAPRMDSRPAPLFPPSPLTVAEAEDKESLEKGFPGKATTIS